MRVVGLGASAGGMEALIALLSKLPDNTGAAFVLILHLSPDHRSIMDELLAKHTSMPVSVVDNTIPVSANHIYIIANDKNLTLDNNLLLTHPRSPNNGLNLPIDQFFHSLGKSQKEHAIGVILSGTGTDGSRGVRTIKEAGGLVLVQSPESAKFDGMPQEVIRLHLADKICPPEELARVLAEIIIKAGRVMPEEIPDSDPKTGAFGHNYLERVLKTVRNTTGVDFSGYREATLQRRLANRILLHRLDDAEAYIELLNQREVEVYALQKDFLIGVTRFFRNPAAFETLENLILPQLFDQRIKDEPVRIWVPACSTGEEAYSIAMLIARYLKKNNLEYDFKIFGTDIDSAAIKLASEGVFSYNCSADIPEDLLARSFIKESDFYRIKGAIRDKMLFAVHNLLKDPPFIHMDLISCRNALIYFKNDAQRAVLSTFHFALNPTGHLFLGPSESLGEVKYAYLQLDKKWNIFKRKDNTQLPYASKFRAGPAPVRLPTSRHLPDTKPSPDRDVEGNVGTQDPFTRYLLDHYVPTLLFVSEDLNVMYIQGRVEHLFAFPKGRAGFNLRSMLSAEQLTLFEQGVRQSLEQEKYVVLKGVELGENEPPLVVDLRFRRTELPQVSQRVAMVELLSPSHTPDADTDGSKDIDEKIRQETLLKDHIRILESKLSEANQNSRELVSRLESTNEELQTSNRELIAANEELQSTNEELQSVNEELYTVNNELQLKNDNLKTANNDINNLLKSTEIGTIFLDADLRIRRFTPAVRQQFQLLETDIGRSITDFSSTLQHVDIGAISRRVFERLESFEQEVTDHAGNHYLLRILPYRTGKHEIKGLVINFVDVNELMKVKEQTRTFANKFQAIFEYSNEIIMVLDKDSTVQQVNKIFSHTEPEVLLGSNLCRWLPDDAGRQLEESIEMTCKERAPREIEMELTRENGHPSFYNGCVIPMIDPEHKQSPVESIIIIWQDITQQVRKHQKMADAVREFESFMDHAVHQIILLDRNGIIKHINFIRFRQLHKSELIGKRIHDFVTAYQAEQIDRAIQQVFAGTNSEKIEYDLESDDQPKRRVELIGTPVIINNSVKYAALIVNDRAV